MKKKKEIFPQYIKNASGKTTYVYLPFDTYESMMVACKEWKKIQKEKGVRWVQISREKPEKKIDRKRK
jgi:hypothetical protein